MKSRNGNEFGRFVSDLYKEITGQKHVFHYVNLTEKYISIKIDANHLSTDQLKEFDQKMKESKWKERYIQVVNRQAKAWYSKTGQKEKVLVRFTKL